MKALMQSISLVSLLLFSVGCDTIVVTPRPAPSDPRVEPAAVIDPGDAPCETLRRGACMQSVVCTLVSPTDRPSTTYLCRPAEGNCEVGLTQTEADVDRCNQRTGCRWNEGTCYCGCRGVGRSAVEDGEEARSCRCECGGGPPPGCVRR